MGTRKLGCGESGMANSDELRATRVRTRKRLTYIGFTQIVFAVLAMVVGVVKIVMSKPDFTWPHVSPLLLVTGILFAISGVFAIMAGRRNDENEPSSKEKQLVTVHYVLCVVCISLAINATVFSALAVASCSTTKIYNNSCQHNISARRVLGILSIILGAIIAILSLAIAIFFCTYQRAYKTHCCNKTLTPRSGGSKAVAAVSYSNTSAQ